MNFAPLAPWAPVPVTRDGFLGELICWNISKYSLYFPNSLQRDDAKSLKSRYSFKTITVVAVSMCRLNIELYFSTDRKFIAHKESGS